VSGAPWKALEISTIPRDLSLIAYPYNAISRKISIVEIFLTSVHYNEAGDMPTACCVKQNPPLSFA
jgi:hypothetical protein